MRTTKKTGLSAVVHEMAVQDWVLAIYLVALLVLTVAGEGPRRATALRYLAIDLIVYAVALGLTRGQVLAGKAHAIVYRLGIFVAIFGSFSQLQYILPTARSVRVDGALYAFDHAVFGFEPAEVFDRFVTPETTEWFSFFYFGYFFILAAHLLPFMFAVRNIRLVSELAIGMVLLFCVGHLLYVAVPGYGPYQHLAGRFAHELDGPLWWRCVRATVDAGEVSARTDIFPSLHTAAPTFLALFSFRHRRALTAFRLSWLPMALFASQIVVSTMFLRWHYLIDVFAGLALAALCSTVAARVGAWEAAWRERTARSPVFDAPWVGRPTRRGTARLVPEAR